MDDYGNAARWPEFRQGCIDNGIWPGVWLTDAWRIGETPADAFFTVAEIESEGDRQGVLNAPPLPPIPKAVLINGTAFTDPSGVPQPEKAATLISAGWKCLVEAYPGETNDVPPMLNLAAQLGWPKAQPVFGVHMKPLSYFTPWMKGGWGIYLSEYVLV
jgi:hypothetical protein